MIKGILIMDLKTIKKSLLACLPGLALEALCPSDLAWIQVQVYNVVARDCTISGDTDSLIERRVDFNQFIEKPTLSMYRQIELYREASAKVGSSVIEIEVAPVSFRIFIQNDKVSLTSA